MRDYVAFLGGILYDILFREILLISFHVLPLYGNGIVSAAISMECKTLGLAIIVYWYHDAHRFVTSIDFCGLFIDFRCNWRFAAEMH